MHTFFSQNIRLDPINFPAIGWNQICLFLINSTFFRLSGDTNTANPDHRTSTGYDNDIQLWDNSCCCSCHCRDSCQASSRFYMGGIIKSVGIRGEMPDAEAVIYSGHRSKPTDKNLIKHNSYQGSYLEKYWRLFSKQVGQRQLFSY